jgi:hypothetical protein
MYALIPPSGYSVLVPSEKSKGYGDAEQQQGELDKVVYVHVAPPKPLAIPKPLTLMATKKQR